jgi:hypothetical protein
VINSDNKSWIKFKPQANNGFAQQLQFDPLSQDIPQECIFKSDQWVLLLRSHAEGILSLVDSLDFDIFKTFSKVESL